jgi:hypothetical protein
VATIANAAYATVYVWAVFPIRVRYPNDTPIAFADYAGIVIVVSSAIWGWFRSEKGIGHRPMDPT